MDNPRLIAEHAFTNIPGIDKVENVAAYYFDTKMRLIRFNIVSKGTVNKSLVHQRDVFRGACEANATSIVLVHNHPTGDTSPSNEDRTLTTTLIKAGQILDMAFMDHIVVGGVLGSDGNVGYYSFRERTSLWNSN